eukprot:UN34119
MKQRQHQRDEVLRLKRVEEQKITIKKDTNETGDYFSPNGIKYPREWGAPPKAQTRDYRKLPGNYGHGSGTLARWIQEKMEASEKKLFEINRGLNYNVVNNNNNNINGTNRTTTTTTTTTTTQTISNNGNIKVDDFFYMHPFTSRVHKSIESSRATRDSWEDFMFYNFNPAARRSSQAARDTTPPSGMSNTLIKRSLDSPESPPAKRQRI